MTSSDARMLITAGEVLTDMPTVAALFAEQQLSWSVVRAIVVQARRMSIADRELLDRRLAALFARYQGLDGYSPDELLAAVDQAVRELRDPRSVEREEQQRERASFLAVQPAFDGAARGYFELEAALAAPVLNALDAKAGPPAAGSGTTPEPGTPRLRAQQRAVALAGICADWLGGDTQRPARPLATYLIDVADTHVNAFGRIELNTPGPMPAVTLARLEELLNDDHDLRAVLFDGARPLAVSRKVRAVDICDDVRLAIRARDGGDRFPGSNLPSAYTDIHHIDGRDNGHHPDRLVSLGRRGHKLIHDHDWHTDLDPDTGTFTIRRNGRSYRSLPRGTSLEPSPPPDPQHGPDPPRRE